ARSPATPALAMMPACGRSGCSGKVSRQAASRLCTRCGAVPPRRAFCASRSETDGSGSRALVASPVSSRAMASWASRAWRIRGARSPARPCASSRRSSSRAGRSRWKVVSSGLPARSAIERTSGSVLTNHSSPQTETFSRRTGMPRLAMMAGRFTGVALKSASCLASSTRNWSGFFQWRNSTLSAQPDRAPVSTMWMSGKLTAAVGPASTRRSRGAAWADRPGASRIASRQRRARRYDGRSGSLITECELLSIAYSLIPDRRMPMTKVNPTQDSPARVLGHPLFKDAPAEVARLLLRDAAVLHAEDGDTLFREGEDAVEYLYVLSGGVEVLRHTQDGLDRVFHIFRVGQLLAETAMFMTHGRYPMNARAHGDAIVLCLKR